MHSDKNRGARTEPWRGVRVKEKAKEKKLTNQSKKDQEDQEGSQEKMVSWNPGGYRALGRRELSEMST